MGQYLDLDGLKILLAKIKENGAFISPSLSGTPTAPTAPSGTNSTQLATTAFVQAALAALVGSAPETLDTLKELGDALGNDPNFAATIATQLGLKAPLANPNLTGIPTAPTASAGTNTTQLATTAFVQAAITNKTSITGNAATASKLATARTISIAGDVAGSASFDGNSNITINVSGITAIPSASITDLFK